MLHILKRFYARVMQGTLRHIYDACNTHAEWEGLVLRLNRFVSTQCASYSRLVLSDVLT